MPRTQLRAVNWRHRPLSQALLAVTVALLCPTTAKPHPFEGLFHHVEADPDKDYLLEPHHGPWMVMAASFSGEGAHQHARELLLELRRDFHIEAYLYNKSFDYTERLRARGLTPKGKPATARYARNRRVHEVAVLAGHFHQVDDPAAQKALKTLKSAEIQCLTAKNRQRDNRNLGGFREVQNRLQELIDQTRGRNSKRRGPLRHAFLTTNPLIDDEYFRPPGMEPFVVELNKQVPYSILSCPGRYTVKVATFTGAKGVKPQTKEEIATGKFSRLEEAAARAHQLTKELRRKNYEAYQFHDRSKSVVCVGSFDSLGPQHDGRIALDPSIARVIHVFRAYQPGDPLPEGARLGQPKRLLDIPFDVMPEVFEVPKESVSSVYAWRAGR